VTGDRVERFAIEADQVKALRRRVPMPVRRVGNIDFLTGVACMKQAFLLINSIQYDSRFTRFKNTLRYADIPRPHEPAVILSPQLCCQLLATIKPLRHGSRKGGKVCQAIQRIISIRTKGRHLKGPASTLHVVANSNQPSIAPPLTVVPVVKITQAATLIAERYRPFEEDLMTHRQNLLCRYHYDPLDRVVSSTLPTRPTILRFYQRHQLATEIQDKAQCSIMQYGRQLLAQQHKHDGLSETGLFATDLQSSVLATTDATRLQHDAYTPYGHRTDQEGALTALGFNGERQDPVTGHYLLGNGHRAYNPVLMRFNSPDALSPFGEGGLNSYAYCSGDPVNRTDPTGQFSVMRMFDLTMGALVASPPSRAVFGTASKPIKNFREIAPGIRIFDDIYKGQPRLNVLAHGGTDAQPPQKPAQGSFSAMGSGRNTVMPEDLYDLLRRYNVAPEDAPNIRLIACFLADTSEPFAARFSNLTGRPVKAYSGTVSAFEHPPLKEVPMGTIDESVTRIIITKGGPMRFLVPYRPRKFLPQSSLIRG